LEITWTPPKDWMRIKTIDVHTAGDPLRVILEGFPPIPGRTILEKRCYLKNNLDFLRTT
jgi:trans-L-3-hydroxyproline dehydratase